MVHIFRTIFASKISGGRKRAGLLTGKDEYLTGKQMNSVREEATKKQPRTWKNLLQEHCKHQYQQTPEVER